MEVITEADIITKQENLDVMPREAKTIEKSPSSDTTKDELLSEPVVPVIDESKILTGKKLFFAFIGMLLSVLLIALDQTILSPALGPISSAFNALDKIGWIVSGYFLTQAAFTLTYGQLLLIFDRRMIFLVAILLFEIGSTICGAANSVEILIFGRCFAGVGAAGIFVSVLSIIGEVTRLEDRPMLLGAFGAVFGLSSLVGPLLGGVFTDHVTWRWCFYINLPVGLVTVLSIVFLIPASPAPPLDEAIVEGVIKRWSFLTRGKYCPKEGSILFKLASLDFVGAILMLAITTSLVMVLQWGGVTYSWGDATIIGLFVCIVGLIVLLVCYEQWLAGFSQLLPLRYFKNRNINGACLIAFSCMFAILLGAYYLPLYYQITRNHSATKSGIDILPFMLILVAASGISGVATSKTGRYIYWFFGAPVLTAVGSGLLYTIDSTESSAFVIGGQVLVAFGIGCCFQLCVIVVQANVDQKDIPPATALLSLIQLLGGTCGIAIAQSVFANGLRSNLEKLAPASNIDALVLSAADVWNESVTSPEIRPAVIEAFAKSLGRAFIIGVPLAGLTIIAACIIKNTNIKGKKMEMHAA